MQYCPKRREILVAGSLNNSLLDRNYSNCIDWLEDVFRELDKNVAAIFVTLLWNSWNDRNNMVFKGKMDAAKMIWERAQTGVGAVARDHDRFVIEGCYNFEEKAMDVIWAELDVFKEGLKLAERLKIGRLIVESDSATLVKKRRMDISIFGQCVKRECDAFSKFESVQVTWINRNSNYAANSLCKLAIRNKNDLYFDMEYPLDIHNIIINDAIN
ncbi:hypothetical protein Godav_002697 [Gossypium davidsonii]|uniref:RNase H type-1 domain-containing protein n=2 Tax=Gossypium TaxID=3633 RepID=A0A7J8SXV8_GOSDV|nr:hypothetical protein [Gossypium davidsonii]MBA0666337.1 hypothetical protein [Gossypium klotzschianum]